jgi:hypothetical protein
MSTWCREWWPRPVVAAAILLLAGQARAAEFVISYVEIQHEVRPRQAIWSVNKSVTLKLSGDNTISEDYTSRTRDGRSASLSGEGKFRDTMVHGSQSATSWRVESADTLVRTWLRAQHIETMRVTVSGTNCSATISYQLKPGFTEYMMPAIRDRQPLYFSQVSAQSITCRAAD